MTFLRLTCMCVYIINTHSNSKINYSRDSKFQILQVYQMEMLLEIISEDWINSLYTGTYKRIRKQYSLWKEVSLGILIFFDCIKCNEINIHFCHSQKTCDQDDMV